MLQRLQDYYRTCGILSTHFRCDFCLSSCAADQQIDARFAMDDTGDGDARPCPKCGAPMKRSDGERKCAACDYRPEFTGPKSSYVGTEYERSEGLAQGGLPKLLLLSPDSGGGHWDARRGLPEEVRQWEEKHSKVADWPLGKHWQRTHELASYILRAFDPRFVDEESVKGHFAHVNVAKCSQNKYAHAQADDRLIENCRAYLPGELEILRPDIVVTQGVKAGDAIRHLWRGRISQVESDLEWVQMNDGHRFLWLWTYHPTSRPRESGQLSPFDRQADFDDSGKAQGWERFARRIRQLLEKPTGK